MEKHLILTGKSIVFIDWANVYGWTKSLKREVDPAKLFAYLKMYDKIKDIRLYFGTDTHPKSIEFLSRVKTIGYNVITKPVKYIPVAQVDGQKIYRRKCDFDMEVCIDVHQVLRSGCESFIFFTGDGDYAPLYRMLLGIRKQVIVIFAAGHLGKEIWEIERGLFKAQVKNLIDV